MRTRAIGVAAMIVMAACGGAPDTEGDPPAARSASPGPAPASPPSFEAPPDTGPGPSDDDPDRNADPSAPSPSDDPSMGPATQGELLKKFAPHLNLHPQEKNMPANVDWFLARTTLRFQHDNCPDHEVLALGKVNQTSLVAQTHAMTKGLPLCGHSSDVRTSTTEPAFFLRIENDATRAGAPRAEWKVYTVWRPDAKTGLVAIEYWFFYAYNDAFLVFDHEADWEHLTVTIDPKAEGGQGKLVQVFFSEHKAGTTLKAGDAGLVMDGTHPVSFVAIGTHANYAKAGTYDVEGTHGIEHDKALANATPWHTEDDLVLVGTRSAPKNGQTFIKFWGHWGDFGDLPETNGITRHFP